MTEILIKQKKQKKHIKHISDWTMDHFGFNFLELDSKETNSCPEEVSEKEKIKVVKAFLRENKKDRKSSQMFFYNKPILISKKSKKKKDVIGLDIINIPTAIAEATVIKTAIVLLKEEGYKNISISLNAIGDKESQKNFKIALSEYYEEHKTQIKSLERKKVKSDPLTIYFNKSKKYLKEINQDAPKPINYLSEESIKHFQETIEYIENMDIPYKIQDDLIGSQLFFSKIIFKIFASEPGKKEIVEVGYGGRYDEVFEKAAKKDKEVSAIGLVLNFKKRNKTKLKLKEKKYNLHLLKIGSTARLKSLEVLEILNKMQIPVEYKIDEEKISKQIKIALNNDADYALLIGEIEAKEDKVLIRNMKNASQKEVKIKSLPKYLKKFLK